MDIGEDVDRHFGQRSDHLLSHVPLRVPAELPLTRDVAHLVSAQLSSSMLEPERAFSAIEMGNDSSISATRWV